MKRNKNLRPYKKNFQTIKENFLMKKRKKKKKQKKKINEIRK